jgi:predicted RNA-binding protein YlqC (UPF0109 family)
MSQREWRGERRGGGRGRGGDRSREGGQREPVEFSDDLSSLGKLVDLLARALVDQPDKVVVREAHSESFPRVELAVAQEDIGKVIGKDGRTAQSIRSLLSAAAMRSGRRVQLDIVD